MIKTITDLPFRVFREGRQYVAYVPALDLSTCGRTLEQTKARLAEAVTIFFEELNKRGTTNEALRDLGWTRAANRLTPPVVVVASYAGGGKQQRFS